MRSKWMLAAVLVLVACGGNDDNDDFQAPGDDADVAVDDTGQQDVVEDTAEPDTAEPDTALPDTEDEPVPDTVDETDAEVGPTCGDGTADEGEDCDGDDLAGMTCVAQGFDAGSLLCAMDCTFDTTGCEDLPECGDGTVDGDEECDDGGNEDGDGCDADCRDEYCGDGFVQDGLAEACEPGGAILEACPDAPDVQGIRACLEDCTFDTLLCPDPALCGNGEIDVGESCDDGGTTDGDGCGADCVTETCGNESLDAYEACDTGGFNVDFTCADFGFDAGEIACDACAIDYSDCHAAVCGDGAVEGREECDDGGTEDGDGCDRRCRIDDSCDDTDRIWTYPDADEDGYGAVGMGDFACGLRPGWVRLGGDCDDGDAMVGPHMNEACDAVADIDCDGVAGFSAVDLGTVAETVFSTAVEDVYFGRTMVWDANLGGEDAGGLLVGANNYLLGQDTGSFVKLFLPPFGALEDGDVPDAVWTAETGAELGVAIEPLGDIDGDGFTDFAVGVPAFDTLGGRGSVFFFDGPLTGSFDETMAVGRIDGVESPDLFGTSIANLGDLDGDGEIDLLIGAPAVDDSVIGNDGAAFLFDGPYTGTRTTADAEAVLYGEQQGDEAGQGVTAVGDVDGDGMGDLLVTSIAYPQNNFDGRAYLFLSPVTGSLQLADADAIISAGANGRLGVASAALGDVNGDGFDDFAITEPGRAVPTVEAGQVLVFYGPVSGNVTADDADVVFWGRPGQQLGGPLAVGDLDGDGAWDMAVSTTFAPCLVAGNALYLAYGPFDESRPIALGADAYMYPASNGRLSDIGVGDIDGDGADEVFIGGTAFDGDAAAYIGRGWILSAP